MRSTNKLICMLAVCCGGSLVAYSRTGAAQSSEPRYGMPPAADFQPAAPLPGPADSAAVAGEPLLSYRRNETTDTATPAAKESRLASSATLEDSNPLRKTVEQPIRPQAIMSAPTAEMPAVEAALLQPIPTPSTAEAADLLTASATATPPAMSDPFPPLAGTPKVAETPAIDASVPTTPLARYDMAVQPAVHEAEAPPVEKISPGQEVAPAASTVSSLMSRQLAPPSSGLQNPSISSEPSPDDKGEFPFAFSKLESFTTAGAGLAIVVGLFLICAWTLRRGGPKTGGMLPSDAFAVLGRAPLTSQSFAHLLRVGNKLVLVAMSSDGIQPLTEVTDPMEVDRLTGLCASGRGHGPATEFKQVLAQLAKEPTRGFLGAEAPDGGRRR